MKRILMSVFLPLTLIPLLSGCRNCNYPDYISDARYDLFLAQTEEFTLSVACLSKETPYLSDGIPCPRSDRIEITLTPLSSLSVQEISCTATLPDGKIFGGEMSFQSVTGEYLLTGSCDDFPKESVSVTIALGESTHTLTATSVKNANTLTVEQALALAVGAERERVDSLTQGKFFSGEFHVRLLRRNKNYYYVAIIGTDGRTTALLLDGETGEALAKRES